MADHQLFYYLACVPLLGILAQWLAWRLRIPAILLLLGLGIALGWVISPDDLLARVTDTESSVGPKLLFPMVSLAVAVVLLEGGLTLKFSDIRTAKRAVAQLCTIGALIAWVLTALAAHWILGLDTPLAALLGAILVVTGPTVVIPLLRQVRPSRRVASVLKWEGIVVDPVGAVLAVLVFEHVAQAAAGGTARPLWELTQTMLVGGAIGWLVAWFLARCVQRFWIPDFLHGVVFLTVSLAAFALSNRLQSESGLVTVTVIGVVLANYRGLRIHHVLEFKEHLTVLLISVLFVVLGSRLDIRDLLAVGPRGLLFVLAMIAVIRPVSVLLSTLRTDLTWRERAFIACLAPRGVVAASVTSIFVLKLVAVNVPFQHDPRELESITFLVIVGTVSFYGLLAGPLARQLGLADANPQGILFAGADPWVRRVAALLRQEGLAVLLVDTNYANVAAARMAGLSAECASILSEHVRENLDLNGIGRLLAVTENDEVNTLAAREYIPMFGRANVYQLVAGAGGTGPRQSVADHLRERRLFGVDCRAKWFQERLEQGAQIKRTQLTDSFTAADFLRIYGPSASILFVIGEDRRLRIATADAPRLQPRARETVIALVDAPVAAPRDASRPDAVVPDADVSQ